jgi:hypothetical protein
MVKLPSRFQQNLCLLLEERGLPYQEIANNYNFKTLLKIYRKHLMLLSKTKL